MKLFSIIALCSLILCGSGYSASSSNSSNSPQKIVVSGVTISPFFENIQHPAAPVNPFGCEPTWKTKLGLSVAPPLVAATVLVGTYVAGQKYLEPLQAKAAVALAGLGCAGIGGALWHSQWAQAKTLLADFEAQQKEFNPQFNAYAENLQSYRALIRITMQDDIQPVHALIRSLREINNLNEIICRSNAHNDNPLNAMFEQYETYTKLPDENSYVSGEIIKRNWTFAEYLDHTPQVECKKFSDNQEHCYFSLFVGNTVTKCIVNKERSKRHIQKQQANVLGIIAQHDSQAVREQKAAVVEACMKAYHDESPGSHSDEPIAYKYAGYSQGYPIPVHLPHKPEPSEEELKTKDNLSSAKALLFGGRLTTFSGLATAVGALLSCAFSWFTK